MRLGFEVMHASSLALPQISQAGIAKPDSDPSFFFPSPAQMKQAADWAAARFAEGEDIRSPTLPPYGRVDVDVHVRSDIDAGPAEAHPPFAGRFAGRFATSFARRFAAPFATPFAGWFAAPFAAPFTDRTIEDPVAAGPTHHRPAHGPFHDRPVAVRSAAARPIAVSAIARAMRPAAVEAAVAAAVAVVAVAVVAVAVAAMAPAEWPSRDGRIRDGSSRGGPSRDDHSRGGRSESARTGGRRVRRGRRGRRERIRCWPWSPAGRRGREGRRRSLAERRRRAREPTVRGGYDAWESPCCRSSGGSNRDFGKLSAGTLSTEPRCPSVGPIDAKPDSASGISRVSCIAAANLP